MPPKTIRMNKAMMARDATIAPIIFSTLCFAPLRLKTAAYQTKHLTLSIHVKLSYFSSGLFIESTVDAAYCFACGSAASISSAVSSPSVLAA
jgi:hypothetical protein